MTLDTASIIAQNLETVRQRMAAAARTAGRNPDDITLVAVSKTHTPDAVRAAIAAGQIIFGENRVQEAASKFPVLRDEFPQLRLHLIGPLQTNKVAQAVSLFDVIESVDREKLAKALAEACQSLPKAPRLLIQVNTGEEPQKSGIAPTLADGFIDYCRKDLKLDIEGLMCVPPVHDQPAPHFALLRTIAKRHGLRHLSMGMSHDFVTAIAQGSTEIRVGTAIFGVREPVPSHT